MEEQLTANELAEYYRQLAEYEEYELLINQSKTK